MLLISIFWISPTDSLVDRDRRRSQGGDTVIFPPRFADPHTASVRQLRRVEPIRLVPTNRVGCEVGHCEECCCSRKIWGAVLQKTEPSLGRDFCSARHRGWRRYSPCSICDPAKRKVLVSPHGIQSIAIKKIILTTGLRLFAVITLRLRHRAILTPLSFADRRY